MRPRGHTAWDQQLSHTGYDEMSSSAAEVAFFCRTGVEVRTLARDFGSDIGQVIKINDFA